MKNLILTSIALILCVLVVNAQTPELKFELAEYDFGSIEENGGKVTAVFEFTNSGEAPLIINGVSASCGCAVAEWTSEAVPTNGKGYVKVSYNPKGRPGLFKKAIKVKSNSSEQPFVLRIQGEVIRNKTE